MRKLSKYNVYAKEDGKTIVYNSVTKNVVKVPDGLLDDISKGRDIELEYIEMLEKRGMVVNSTVCEEKRAIYEYNKMAYSSEMLDLTIIPTMECNFNCRYCFQNSHNGKMSKETRERVKLFLKKACNKYRRIAIEWFGGEPLLQCEEIIEIMESVKEWSSRSRTLIVGSMTTNGYLLDAVTMEKLYKRGIQYYQISLDGDKEIHDYQRPHKTNSDSFERIYHNLLSLRALPTKYRFVVGIRINVSSLNKERLYPLIDRIKEDFGQDKRFRIMIQWVRDWGGSSIEQNPDIVANALESEMLFEYCIEKGIECVNYLTCSSGISFCGACKVNSMVIHQDGRLYKCAMSLDDLSMVEKNLLGQIDAYGNACVDEMVCSQWLGVSNLKEKCRNCEQMPLCMGGPCPLATQINGKNFCHNSKSLMKYYLRNLDAIGKVSSIQYERGGLKNE